MRITDVDIIFISYDEPNAEDNYANLLFKAPWVKRVHGIKGSDAAHKAAADLADTDWFVTVDGDNKVYDEFFKLDLTLLPGIQTYSWCGKNNINGLAYGNGGVKLWNKKFALSMKTHEESISDKSQIEFCWEDGYQNFPVIYSDTIINTTPYQAWRAGFREGVKMLTLEGSKVEKNKIYEEIYWHNLHRLRMWSSVGSHIENGIYAILGARHGSVKTYTTNWNHIEVRNFEDLDKIYNQEVLIFENDKEKIVSEIKQLGKVLKIELGLDWAFFEPEQSHCVAKLYQESLLLGQTYYKSNV